MIIPGLRLRFYGINFFSHPDFTVGTGITPVQPLSIWQWVADYTAGWELHPTPKNSFYSIGYYNPLYVVMQAVFLVNFTKNFT